MSVYASLGSAQREPSRMDMLLGEDNATVPHDLEAVRPEEVLDLEARRQSQHAEPGAAGQLYAMEFTNEIALTGELSEIGLPLRRNVDDSYRRGLEVDLKWMATRELVDSPQRQPEPQPDQRVDPVLRRLRRAGGRGSAASRSPTEMCHPC